MLRYSLAVFSVVAGASAAAPAALAPNSASRPPARAAKARAGDDPLAALPVPSDYAAWSFGGNGVDLTVKSNEWALGVVGGRALVLVLAQGLIHGAGVHPDWDPTDERWLLFAIDERVTILVDSYQHRELADLDLELERSWTNVISLVSRTPGRARRWRYDSKANKLVGLR